MTLQEFAGQFQHPFLRKAIRFFLDSPGWPMVQFPMIPLAGFVRSGVTEAGAPLGGSQQVMFHLADLFRELGGELHYKCRIQDLIRENNRVTGVILDDGSKQLADSVIWAGDGYSLIYEILEGKYINDRIRNMYEKWIPVKSIVHVMMGVNRDLSDYPHNMIFEADEQISVAGEEHHWLNMLHHCFDPSMAPQGKSAVEVWYASDYEYWEELYKNKSAYKAEKKRIADLTVRQLDKRLPGFASQVEVIDVPTPATYHRYTGNWKGSPDGWYITPENMRVQEPVRSLPGLEGLNMAGQWTAPFTGTVLAALSGRQVIQLMCREEGKGFIHSAPASRM
jgi:phytoene dehydrogenase-like protein